MDNKDRYALMGLIVKFFDDGPIAQEDFSQKYSDELIKPRNKLAHAKLVYGKCHQKLHPIKNAIQSVEYVMDNKDRYAPNSPLKRKAIIWPILTRLSSCGSCCTL